MEVSVSTFLVTPSVNKNMHISRAKIKKRENYTNILQRIKGIENILYSLTIKLVWCYIFNPLKSSMTSLFPYIGSAILCLMVAIFGIEVFTKWKILDKPGPDVPNRAGVPNMQGIFLILGFVGSMLIFFPDYLTQKPFLGLLFGGLLIGIVESIDTILGLNYQGLKTKGLNKKIRVVIQIIVAMIAMFIGGINIETITIGNLTITIPFIIAAMFLIIWFGGFMNAINRFDGINGLSSWVSTIGFLTIYLLLQHVVFPSFPFMSEENAVLLSMITNIAFVMTILGMIYTTIEYKPIGRLRDIGTMFLGFSLAYLALLGGAKIGTILVALSLPIFDAIWVFINRIFIMKKSPLRGDYTHLHYRLLALGRDRNEIRRFVWGRSIFFMIIILLQDTNRMAKVIIFLMMAIIFFGVNVYLFRVKKMPMEYKVEKK